MDSPRYCRRYHPRQQQLETERAVYESLWQEIADFMLPRAGVFTTKGTPQLRPQVFDSTAVLALDRSLRGFREHAGRRARRPGTC